MSMTREEIIKAYEDAVVESGLAAAAGNEEAAKSYELFKAGLYALRPVSRERVERIRGTWEPFGGKYLTRKKCSRCGWDGQEHIKFYSWCPNCGSPMTDEAVEMVMERLNKLEETKK